MPSVVPKEGPAIVHVHNSLILIDMVYNPDRPSAPSHGRLISAMNASSIGQPHQFFMSSRRGIYIPTSIADLQVFMQKREQLQSDLRHMIELSQHAISSQYVLIDFYRMLFRDLWWTLGITIDPKDDRLFSWADEPEDLLSFDRRRSGRLSTLIQRAQKRGISINCSVPEQLYAAWGEYRIDRTKYRITEVTGEDILDLYVKGPQSCMRGVPSSYLDLYTKNPDHVSALKIIYDDRYVARAIVWKTDQGVTVLDRIYPNSGPHVQIAIEYARENGWRYRRNQSAGMKELDDVGSYTVTIFDPQKHYPYIDTFGWGWNESEATLVLTNSSDDDRIEYQFHHQHGGWIDVNLDINDNDDEFVDDGD